MNLDLTNQKCQSCSGNTPKLNEQEISNYLSKLNNWHVNDEQKMIYKKFKFKTFNKALIFTNKVGDKFIIDSDITQIDNEDAWDRTRDFVRRKDSSDGIWKLYDRVNHTFEFPDDDYFYVHVTRLLSFEDLPAPFQRYIIYKASGRAAVQLVSNANLQKMLATYEAQARGACVEYECNQGDHNFMGWPDESAYQSYKPYQSLRR